MINILAGIGYLLMSFVFGATAFKATSDLRDMVDDWIEGCILGTMVVVMWSCSLYLVLVGAAKIFVSLV